ncbi:cytochrome b-c1 complex subunit 9 [Cimex lectularius]|uniref:Complex III subunit 9 n=1 Tax=Cimex lectularius TaxID=79782 RepID=A0A8I6RBR5_CIMLE|nr:cytochrome b-c1 complex subunit 9 [Cimex lectularius]
MGLTSRLYNTVFKRSSTYAVVVVVGAFFFERTFDLFTDYYFENKNQGKLWKHIKQNYETSS